MKTSLNFWKRFFSKNTFKRALHLCCTFLMKTLDNILHPQLMWKKVWAFGKCFSLKIPSRGPFIYAVDFSWKHLIISFNLSSCENKFELLEKKSLKTQAGPWIACKITPYNTCKFSSETNHLFTYTLLKTIVSRRQTHNTFPYFWRKLGITNFTLTTLISIPS